MKTNKLLISLVIALFGIALVSSSALAGSKQSHRWEGVAIGIGAAILGHAIYQSHMAVHRPEVVYVEPERIYGDNHGPEHRCGHWEWQKTWVPPIYERVWNPGHYNRNGRWVSGHWMEVETSDGHWIQDRVWVADNHGRY
ncbi:hypothetical protein [uncultured Desulfosarcina sp.]|uniref:hypothetical protein n=1 Tax=uncultured Desulfosarcina sp. TaxID=218289 RepID=UPI0029C80F48|nr:hypothetical protein [uncultured Desulfosarcina sp.]